MPAADPGMAAARPMRPACPAPPGFDARERIESTRGRRPLPHRPPAIEVGRHFAVEASSAPAARGDHRRARRRAHARAPSRDELPPDASPPGATGSTWPRDCSSTCRAAGSCSSTSSGAAGRSAWRPRSSSNEHAGRTAAVVVPLLGGAGCRRDPARGAHLRRLPPAPAPRRCSAPSRSISRPGKSGAFWPTGAGRSARSAIRAIACRAALAIALGQRLFFDPRLSSNGAMSCATCHIPERGWADGRRQAQGLAALDRNTPTVLNVGLQRWFSWDGRSDSLWAQSLKPIVDAREMGATARHIAARDPGARRSALPLRARVRGAAGRRRRARAGRHGQGPGGVPGDGHLGPDGVRRVPRCPRRGDARPPPLSLAARRGADVRRPRQLQRVPLRGRLHQRRIHDVGVPFLVAPGRVDPGRHGGIRATRRPVQSLRPYSDDASRASATKTRHVDLQHSTSASSRRRRCGTWPSPRPYMHDGRFATLREVVRHYSELDMERIHTHGEQGSGRCGSPRPRSTTWWLS